MSILVRLYSWDSLLFWGVFIAFSLQPICILLHRHSLFIESKVGIKIETEEERIIEGDDDGARRK